MLHAGMEGLSAGTLTRSVKFPPGCPTRVSPENAAVPDELGVTLRETGKMHA
jgi:hypothetical protein